MAYSITAARCMGCGACAKVCPAHAISGEISLPYAVDPARCTGCGVCGMTCPAGAVCAPDGTVCEKVPLSRRARPVIDERRCTACRICVNFCPVGALRIWPLGAIRGSLVAHAVLEHPEKCVGCGACRRECPLSAVTMRDAVLA